MLEIAYHDEAGDTWKAAVNALPRYVVRIVPAQGSPFDAVLHCADAEAELYGSVIVQRWSRDDSGPVGEPFSIAAERIEVY